MYHRRANLQKLQEFQDFSVWWKLKYDQSRYYHPKKTLNLNEWTVTPGEWIFLPLLKDLGQKILIYLWIAYYSVINIIYLFIYYHYIIVIIKIYRLAWSLGIWPKTFSSRFEFTSRMILLGASRLFIALFFNFSRCSSKSLRVLFGAWLWATVIFGLLTSLIVVALALHSTHFQFVEFSFFLSIIYV